MLDKTIPISMYIIMCAGVVDGCTHKELHMYMYNVYTRPCSSSTCI